MKHSKTTGSFSMVAYYLCNLALTTFSTNKACWRLLNPQDSHSGLRESQ